MAQKSALRWAQQMWNTCMESVLGAASRTSHRRVPLRPDIPAFLGLLSKSTSNGRYSCVVVNWPVLSGTPEALLFQTVEKMDSDESGRNAIKTESTPSTLVLYSALNKTSFFQQQQQQEDIFQTTSYKTYRVSSYNKISRQKFSENT